MRDRRNNTYLTCLLWFSLMLLNGCGSTTWDEVARTTALQDDGPVAAKEKIQFVQGYLNGYEHALAEGKPMLVFFTFRGSEYCRRMVEGAFSNDQVVRLSRRFVCVRVDADQEPEICSQFRVKGYPTIQFISPRGVPLNRLVGDRPADHLTLQMHAALEAVASRTDLDRRTT